MKGKKKISIFVIILGFSIFSLFAFNNDNNRKLPKKTENEAIAVEVYNVRNSNIKKYKKFSGIVSAGEKEIVTPKALSNITSIKVKVGDHVKKGQVLMTLDSSKLDEQIFNLDKTNQQIQGSVNEAKKKLEELQGRSNEILVKKESLENEIKTLEDENINIDDELTELSRKLEAGEITQEEFEMQKKEKEALKASNLAQISKNNIEVKTLDITKQTLDKSISELEKIINNSNENNQISGMLDGLKDKRGDYTVVAGISGVVEELNLKVGKMPISFTKPGILIENTESVDFEFQIMKEDLGNFKVGMEVSTFIDIDGKQEERKAIIESVSSDEDERTKQYKIVATIKNWNNKIKLGSFAKLMIETEVKNNVITIPKDGIIREGEKTFVYINENNIAKKVEVITGIENHNEVEILNGLNIGNKVVIKGKEFIKQEEKIKVVKEVKLNEDN